MVEVIIEESVEINEDEVITSEILSLLNYFIWYDVTTNYYDLVIYFNIIIIYFTIILSSLFRFKKLLDYIIIIIASTTYTPHFYLIYFFKWSYSHINLIHNLIISFLIINTVTHSLDTIYFGIVNEFSSIIFNSIILNNPNIYFNCDNFFIENLNIYSDINNTVFFDWNTLYMTNSLNNHPSLLLFNNNNFFNFYTISRNWLLSYSFIDINYLNSLYNFFTILLIYTLLSYKTQCSVTVVY